jgi:hypothetical protein
MTIRARTEVEQGLTGYSYTILIFDINLGRAAFGEIFMFSRGELL